MKKRRLEAWVSVPMLPSVFICIKEFNGNKVKWYYQIKVSPVLSCTHLLLCDILHNLQSKIEMGEKGLEGALLTDVFIYLFFYILYNVEKHTQNRHRITWNHWGIRNRSSKITDVGRSVADNSGSVGWELVLYSGHLQVGCHLYSFSEASMQKLNANIEAGPVVSMATKHINT